MHRSLILLCLLFSSFGYAQQFSEVVPLSTDLSESSGLIYLNGKIITHTDSQGDAALYEVDSISGNHTRKVTIANATNADWEDITVDSTHIFIGDFGNNDGNRTDLRIYRVLIADYLNSTNDTVYCDTIQFNFADQADFSAKPNANNWDCEAVAAIGDSLYLFTKNWLNAKTYIYPLPKLPGTYNSVKTDSIFVQGLITGADYHIPSNRLTLCGYTQYPFVVEMNNPRGDAFGKNAFIRYNIPTPNLIQLEAIATFDDNKYYLTAESFQGIAGQLYRLSGVDGINNLQEIDKYSLQCYPNPTLGILHFDGEIWEKAEVYNSSGSLLLEKKNVNKIDLSHLPKGTYLIKGKSPKLQLESMQKIVLE